MTHTDAAKKYSRSAQNSGCDETEMELSRVDKTIRWDSII